MAGGTRRGDVNWSRICRRRRTGVLASACSTGHEVLVERDEWKNGAFTKLQGLVDGLADLMYKDTITLSARRVMVTRVTELTGCTQR